MCHRKAYVFNVVLLVFKSWNTQAVAPNTAHRMPKRLCSRLCETKLLLEATESTEISAANWTALSIASMPERQWSPEQQEAIAIVEGGLGVLDANVSRSNRRVLVTGGPGTCKTETVAHLAQRAAAKGLKVFIAVPTGTLSKCTASVCFRII